MQRPGGATYWRPLAYLTFALNWFAGGNEVFGYHFVNILLHSLSACLLFLTILTLFQTPTLRGKHSESVQSVALLASALWAINPIQTQAVTLIVQRMALLAAFFYIGGIFCYLKARLSRIRWQRSMLFSLCLTSWLLGMASKETAVLLPLTLVLVEAIFFHDLGDTKTQKQFLATLIGGSILVAIIGGLLFLKGDPWSIFAGYGDRYFTPAERLMTQPRVLFFYLTLIFCPFAGAAFHRSRRRAVNLPDASLDNPAGDCLCGRCDRRCPVTDPEKAAAEFRHPVLLLKPPCRVVDRST